MDQDTILGIVRHVLTTAGGALVANGVLTGGQLQDAVGAVIALGGIAWSIYQKRGQKARLAAATAAPVSPAS
jgi:uncharacterized membrane protein YebE (DUF533 family)